MAISLVFTSLKPKDLEDNLSTDAFRQLCPEDLKQGANLHLPLWQGGPKDKYKYDPKLWQHLKNSTNPIEQAYFQA
jgi:hypothetical protein